MLELGRGDDPLIAALAERGCNRSFGDFKAINDWLGTRVLRDPYTNKPYVMF